MSEEEEKKPYASDVNHQFRDSMIRHLREQTVLLRKILEALEPPAPEIRVVNEKPKKKGQLQVPGFEETRKDIEDRPDGVQPGQNDFAARDCFNKVLGRQD